MKKSSIEKRMLIGIEIIIVFLLILFFIWYPKFKAEQKVKSEFSEFYKDQEQLKESIDETSKLLEEEKDKLKFYID